MQVFPMAFGAFSPSACQTCGCAETSCESCKTVADCSNCASCCCSTTHQSWRHVRIGNGIRIEYLSSVWMTIEVLGSIGVGLIAGSFALLAFGGDSLIELVSGLAVLGGLRRDSLRIGGLIDRKRTEQFNSFLPLPLPPLIALGAGYSVTPGLEAQATAPR